MLACQLVATVPRRSGSSAAAHWCARRSGSRASPWAGAGDPTVGVPAALFRVGHNLGLMTLTAVVTRLGEADLAAYGLGTRLDFLLMASATASAPPC